MTKPGRVCMERGCFYLAAPRGSRCPDHQRAFYRQQSQVRRREPFYRSREWASMRRKAKETMLARCAICGTIDGRMDLDHIQSIQEAPWLKREMSNVQWLCVRCHSRKTATEARRGAYEQG